LTVDPTSPDTTIWASILGFRGSHVFKSTDRGATWKNQTNNLPNIPVNCIYIHQENTQMIVIGTDLGIIVSMNGGTTWNSDPTGKGFGIGTTAVYWLTFQKSTGTLFAFSHGRGAFKVVISISDHSTESGVGMNFVWWGVVIFMVIAAL
jgi:hypothetical protein